MTRDPIFDRNGDLPVPGFAQAVKEEKESSTPTARLHETLEELRMAGIFGRTWRELAKRLNLHHGQASAALTTLHQAGKLDVLRDVKRDGCGIYIHPDHVGGRPTRQAGKSRATELSEKLDVARAEVQRLEADLAAAGEEVSRLEKRAILLAEEKSTLTSKLRKEREVTKVWRAWRALASLGPDEQDLVKGLGSRLDESGKADDDVVPLKVATLRKILGWLGPLCLSSSEIASDSSMIDIVDPTGKVNVKIVRLGEFCARLWVCTEDSGTILRAKVKSISIEED